MTETAQMRTWAEISLDRLAHNYQTLRAMLAPDCRFLGLCKANAYGHGALQVGRKLEALGADMLAVACVDEARELRQAGITLPILCLGNTPVELAPMLLEYQVTQAVGDLATGQALSDAAVAAGKTLAIHVKLDTGMTLRLGTIDNVDAKLGWVETLMPRLTEEGKITGTLDVTGENGASYIP